MSASAGRVLAINRGDYNSATAYTPMDKVYYLGSTYICIADSTGNLPTNTTYWQIEAKGVSDASDLDYDNTVSGLTADDVQEAIDELASEKQDNLTFDASPTEDSTNPVTSGGVYTALSGKQNTLTFDNVPTENSTNPVKSGGVYSAIEDVQDYAEDNISAIVNAYSAKNYVACDFSTFVSAGITFTRNSDNSYTITTNGSASTGLSADVTGSFTLKKGTYIASFAKDSDDAFGNNVALRLMNATTSTEICSSGLTKAQRTFTLAEDTLVVFKVYIQHGWIVPTQTFYPMIRDARITDPTYVPYAMANRELTDLTRMSEAEHIVGRWIDGKLLYEKTIDFGAMPNATTKIVYDVYPSTAKIVDFKGVMISPQAGYYISQPIPYTNPTDLTYSMGIWAGNGNINVISGIDVSSWSAYITIKYTK